MWKLLNCYLSGRHDFSVSCEPGAIFLRCINCGKRSPGWELKGHHAPLTPAKAQLREREPQTAPRIAQALPFIPRRVKRLHSA